MSKDEEFFFFIKFNGEEKRNLYLLPLEHKSNCANMIFVFFFNLNLNLNLNYFILLLLFFLIFCGIYILLLHHRPQYMYNKTKRLEVVEKMEQLVVLTRSLFLCHFSIFLPLICPFHLQPISQSLLSIFRISLRLSKFCSPSPSFSFWTHGCCQNGRV